MAVCCGGCVAAIGQLEGHPGQTLPQIKVQLRVGHRVLHSIQTWSVIMKVCGGASGVDRHAPQQDHVACGVMKSDQTHTHSLSPVCGAALSSDSRLICPTLNPLSLSPFLLSVLSVYL